MKNKCNFTLLLHYSTLKIDPNEELTVNIYATGGGKVTAGKLAIATSYDVEIINVSNNNDSARGGLIVGLSPDWWGEVLRLPARPEIPYYKIELGEFRKVETKKVLISDEEKTKYSITKTPLLRIKLKSNIENDYEVSFILSYADENNNWGASSKSLVFHVNEWRERHSKKITISQLILAALAIIIASFFAITTILLK